MIVDFFVALAETPAERKYGNARTFRALRKRGPFTLVLFAAIFGGELVCEHLREIGARYGSRVDSWDVVNESATDFAKRFGCKAVRNRPFDESHYGPMPADYAYKAFMRSGKYLPKTAWFNLNDYYMDEGFFQQANDLVANGARIDVVGAQMHLFNPAESVGIS